MLIQRNAIYLFHNCSLQDFYFNMSMIYTLNGSDVVVRATSPYLREKMLLPRFIHPTCVGAFSTRYKAVETFAFSFLTSLGLALAGTWSYLRPHKDA